MIIVVLMKYTDDAFRLYEALLEPKTWLLSLTVALRCVRMACGAKLTLDIFLKPNSELGG